MDCFTNPDLIAKYRDYIFDWKDPFNSILNPINYEVASKRIRTDKGMEIPFKKTNIENQTDFDIVAKKIKINKSCECEIAFSSSGDSEYINLKLMIIHNAEKEVFVKIRLINSNRLTVAAKDFKSHGKKVYFGMQEFFKQEIIWPSKSKGSNEVSIWIRVREMFKICPLDSEAGRTLMEIDDNPFVNIAENYYSLLNYSKPDFTLQVEQREFKVHKCILRLRSPVFAKMFEHKMQENLTNRLKIENFRIETIDNLLFFLYWNRPKSLSMNMVHLFNAARFYQVEDLEFYCLEAIKSRINSYNVFDIYTEACVYMIDELINVCVEFMQKNLNEKTLFRVFYVAMKEKNENLKASIRKYICTFDKTFFLKKEWLEFSINYPPDAIKVLHQYIEKDV